MLAASNQVLERNGIFIPIVHSYLDDLLCFPIVFTVGLAAYRILYRNGNYVLRPWQVWPVVVLYAVVFEVVLPSFSATYTSDPWDMVAYALGTLVFLRWMNRPAQAPIC